MIILDWEFELGDKKLGRRKASAPGTHDSTQTTQTRSFLPYFVRLLFPPTYFWPVRA